MTDTIKRRPDGSIDTGFYMAQGRTMRSETAHHMLRDTAGRTPARSGRAPTLAVLAAAAILIGMVLPFAA